MHDDPFLPMRCTRLRKSGNHGFFAGDIDIAEKCSDRIGHLLAQLRIQVEDRDLDSDCGHGFGRGAPKPGGTPRHNCSGRRINEHSRFLCVIKVLPSQLAIALATGKSRKCLMWLRSTLRDPASA